MRSSKLASCKALMRVRQAWWCWVLVAMGCASSDPSSNSENLTCTPGEQLACSCASGASSVRNCGSDSSHYGPCACDGVPGGDASSDTAALDASTGTAAPSRDATREVEADNDAAGNDVSTD